MFVDTGLLRHGEAEQVEETFRRDFKVNLVHVKAADGTPMANVMLTLMHKLGLDTVPGFGDSTGEFALSV